MHNRKKFSSYVDCGGIEFYWHISLGQPELHFGWRFDFADSFLQIVINKHSDSRNGLPFGESHHLVLRIMFIEKTATRRQLNGKWCRIHGGLR